LEAVVAMATVLARVTRAEDADGASPKQDILRVTLQETLDRIEVERTGDELEGAGHETKEEDRIAKHEELREC